jgi:hypothetical protein
MRVFLPLMANEVGSPFVLGLHLPETSDTIEIPAAVMVRLACHALIQRLPVEAMPEAIESLVQMREFYETPRLKELPSPSMTRHPATWGATVARPVFPVTEDE